MHSLWKQVARMPSLLRTVPSGLSKRFYLTPAYQCTEAFENRHKEPLLENIDTKALYVELLKRMREKLPPFAIDIDVYVQTLKSDGSNWVPDDIIEVLRWLRSNRDSYYALPSTWHTVLRLFVLNSHTEDLFRVLSLPILHGVFLDTHTACLLMDHYLENKDYTHAARIAFHMMLVEDFGNELSQTFVMLSSLRWALSGEENGVWVDYEVKAPEPEEEVLVRSDYHPNPYFDDHFDLKEDNLCVGKTLAWCADTHWLPSDVGYNCQLLGYTMWRKFRKAHKLIRAINESAGKVKISKDVISVAKQHVSEHCSDEELRTTTLAALDSIQTDEGYNIFASLEEILNTRIKEMEGDYVKALENSYSEMASKRVDRMREFEEEKAKKEAIRQIIEKKKELKAQEQEHLFFHNQKKIDLVLNQRGQYNHPFPRPRPWRYSRIRAQKQDTEYIPPDVRRNRNTT